MAPQAQTASPRAAGPADGWRPTGTLWRRLVRLILGTALLSAMVGLVLSGISLTVEFRSRMRDEVGGAIVNQRGLVEESLAANLRSAAQAAALRIAQETRAVAVRIEDHEGSTLAEVTQEGAQAGRFGLTPPTLNITSPVDINGDVVGAVVVDVSSGPVFKALGGFMVTSLFGVILVSTLALLIASRTRRHITQPIGRLLETMDTVSRTKNFGLQATPEGPDEIGSLAISFNELLKQIHSRNQSLAVHRQKLQELVVERTRSFERAAREAEVASRAKGDFLARMSHEIRTPMNGVIGMAELLENTQLADKQHHMLQTMRTSADSLLDIINDILDFSRIEAGQLQVLKTQFSPVDLIEEICELLAPRAHEKNLQLVCDIDPKVPEACAGDPLRLRQIITNLVGNAIKYTQKGSITLRAAAVPVDDAKIRLRVEVEDTGHGIPEQQLEKMFEPFTQGDSFETRKEGGTGLGLAITKQLVTLLGGEVNVASKLGAGSKFWITVPLEVAKAQAPAAPWQSGVKRALVVQYDAPAARVVTRLLEESGAEVTSIRTGSEALDLLVTEEFDLLVLDELLVDMSGYEFVDKLRSSGKAKTMAIVMMTTTVPAAADLVHVSEPDARVSKPVRRVRLRAAIDQARGSGVAPGAPRAEEGTAPRLDLHVLLVEDSPVNREVARGMLETLGCTVETAGDGSVGVEQALSWKFDVVLMDCQMPLVDGFEATSRIRVAEAANGREGMPIVALTANALQGDRERCLAAGMTDFISKPFTMKKLRSALVAARSGKATFELAPANPRVAPAPATAPAYTQELPVVDQRQIDEVRSLGKPGLLQGAIGLFRTQAAATLDQLDLALESRQATDLEANFHALKSCSLSVGARRFAALAGDCEQAVRRGDLDGAARLAAQLRPEYAVLCEALSGITQGLRQAG